MEELALLKVYMELTGATELFARGVWVHVGSHPQDGTGVGMREQSRAGVATEGKPLGLLSMLVLLVASCLPGGAAAAVASIFHRSHF